MSGMLKKSKNKQQSGFSIVELMVSILIGLIILAGVIQVVVSSKMTFIGQEEMSFIQENARYTLNVLSKEVKEAGYLGCAGKAANVKFVADVGADSYELLMNKNSATNFTFSSITGYESKPNGGTTQNFTSFPTIIQGYAPWTGDSNDADSDLIIVRKLVGDSLPLESESSTGAIVAAGAGEFSQGNFAAVVGEDCRRVGIFRVSADAPNAKTIPMSAGVNCGTAIKPTIGETKICGPSGSAGCNSCGSTGQRFQPGSMVYEYEATAFYISESSVMPGQPALKKYTARGDGAGIEEELALGVESLNVKYGVRNGNALKFVDADKVGSGNWASVESATVSLTFRSQSEMSNPGEADRDFIRQQVTTTFGMRN